MFGLKRVLFPLFLLVSAQVATAFRFENPIRQKALNLEDHECFRHDVLVRTVYGTVETVPNFVCKVGSTIKNINSADTKGCYWSTKPGSYSEWKCPQIRFSRDTLKVTSTRGNVSLFNIVSERNKPTTCGDKVSEQFKAVGGLSKKQIKLAMRGIRQSLKIGVGR